MDGAATTKAGGNGAGGKRLLWAGLLAAVAVAVAFTLFFVYPRDGSDEKRFALGPAEDFEVGSVTTFEEGEFHVVRLTERAFIALSWRDPHSACQVPWKEDFVFREQQGWFRDPCDGATYGKDGTQVVGPSPRDLDRYVASVVNGDLIVDTSSYVCGWAPPSAACLELSDQ